MIKKRTIKIFHRLSLFIFFGLPIFHPNTSSATIIYKINTHAVLDSIGTEVVNGNRFVIHKLTPQETYYQLGRIYNVPVKDIMQANNKKNLRVGDTVKIPRGKVAVAIENIQKEVASAVSTPTNPATGTTQKIFTEYKVGKNETLYAISRRFSVSVDAVKRMNNLTSDTLREGQLLKIPDSSNPEPTTPEVVTPIPDIVEERQPIDDSEFRANRYGIREKKERGIGTWMESLGDGQTSLALHKTAPIGTILKITNPMNKSVTFAKVVGKFGDNQETHDAIVVLSKSVATALGLLDKRFLIELNYGAPLE